MELEIYSAFVKAGIPAEEAKAAVESLNKEIDKRYALHAAQLATRGDVESIKKDLAEMENRLLRAMSDMQRWTMGALFAALGALTVISKLWH